MDTLQSPGPGAAMIADERARQVVDEGWTPEHDDEHADGALACAAACYAVPAERRELYLGQHFLGHPATWPWSADWWKPTPSDRMRELVKAGALIAAEIDRMHRNAADRS